uniref:Uncharacterized protein n=1 Tax=Rhizophora mucronata TaxID=61149 RepID=A0A2P2IVT9_RHIMU
MIIARESFWETPFKSAKLLVNERCFLLKSGLPLIC